jgi:crotonobetainyl-CoA:carnitine CoA-transferase CaiB-like acyl-CoA transferase
MKAGPPVADLGGGTFLALAIVSALHHKLRTGEGQVIDISMQDAIWLFTAVEFSPIYFIDGEVPHRYGNAVPHTSPANLYKTSDGYIIIATAELAQAENVFRVIEREDLINTPLCSQRSERIKRRAEIDAIVEEWTKKRTSEEVIARLRAVDVPCSSVPTYDRVCNDPQLLSRNMIIEVEQALSGKVKTPGSLFKLSRTPGNLKFPAPLIGEHNREVYSGSLGYSGHELDEFAKKGVI